VSGHYNAACRQLQARLAQVDDDSLSAEGE
jgi:hypothetical protein